MRRGALVIGAAALALAAASCGRTVEPPTAAEPQATTPAPPSSQAADPESVAPAASAGKPAAASAATRTIEIRMLDSFAFEPDVVRVAEGETVTFLLVNEGQLPHDFTVGSQAMQDEHAEEMAEGMHNDGHGDEHGGGDGPAEGGNAVSVDAGEQAELTWTFAGPGSVQYGCHVPGHYDAGMRGTIVVG